VASRKWTSAMLKSTCRCFPQPSPLVPYQPITCQGATGKAEMWLGGRLFWWDCCLVCPDLPCGNQQPCLPCCPGSLCNMQVRWLRGSGMMTGETPWAGGLPPAEEDYENNGCPSVACFSSLFILVGVYAAIRMPSAAVFSLSTPCCCFGPSAQWAVAWWLV
jgi:hypothetical protein